MFFFCMCYTPIPFTPNKSKCRLMELLIILYSSREPRVLTLLESTQLHSTEAPSFNLNGILYALLSLLDILISRVILSPVFIPSFSYSLTFILKLVYSDILFLLPPNAPSIASDIFLGKSFKSSNEVIGMVATPKGFSGKPCAFLWE